MMGGKEEKMKTPRWQNLTPNMERVVDALTASTGRTLRQFRSGRWAVVNERGALLDTASLTPPEFTALQYEGFINADGTLVE
jgi:hypothetical protein